MNFVKDFYEGSIRPCENNPWTNSEYSSAKRLIEKNKPLLYNRLTENDKVIFDKIINAYNDVLYAHSLINFELGLKIGIKFMSIGLNDSTD